MRITTDCPDCGEAVTYPDGSPGKKVMCGKCGAWVLLPRPAKEGPGVSRETKPAPAQETAGRKRVRRLCPDCGEPLPRGKSRCPECGALYAAARSERSLRQHDGMHGIWMDRAARNLGVLGGLFLVFVAVAWFVAGWIAGYVYFYPSVLAIIGFVAIVQGIASARLKKRLARRRAGRGTRDG